MPIMENENMESEKEEPNEVEIYLRELSKVDEIPHKYQFSGKDLPEEVENSEGKSKQNVRFNYCLSS